MEIVRLLVQYGADTNAKDYSGLTALRIAATQKNVVLMGEMIERGADEVSLLHWALQNDNKPLMKFLLRRLSKFSTSPPVNQRIVYRSLEVGYQESIILLFKQRRDKDAALFHVRDDGDGQEMSLLFTAGSDDSLEPCRGDNNSHKALLRGLLHREETADAILTEFAANGRTGLIRRLIFLRNKCK